MFFYRVRNKRGQVAAEMDERALSVHDQKLSWQLHRLKEQDEFPFDNTGVSGEKTWTLEALLRFVEAEGYTAEREET